MVLNVCDGDVWMWRAPRSIKPSTKFGDGADISTTTSEGNVSTTGDAKDGKQPDTSAKPKTVEGMLKAFETGIKSALEKLGTNVKANAPSGTTNTYDESFDKAFADAGFGSTPSIDPVDIKAVGSIRDDAVQKLKAIKEKAERDETGDIIPIVQERLVIQKVTQQINTSGSTKAVYTKPSPLLSQ